jgi:hypothetical protein
VLSKSESGHSDAGDSAYAMLGVVVLHCLLSVIQPEKIKSYTSLKYIIKIALDILENIRIYTS